MVYRLQLSYDETIDTLDVKYISGPTIGYTLQPDVYQLTDINLVLMPLLPGEVTVKITLDDIRLKSSLNKI